MASRTRSKPIVSASATTRSEQRYTATGKLASTVTSSYYSYHQTETMTDVVVANFRSRRAKGEVFFNPMTKTKVVTTIRPAYFSGRNTSGSITDIGTDNIIAKRGPPLLGAPSTRGSDLDAKRDLASTSALSKASSEEIMILATLGEGKETIDMLKKALRHLLHLKPLLRTYYNLLRRGNKSKGKYARDIYLEAESVWMQIRMGWRPFAFECQQLYGALAKKREYPQRQTFRGGTSDLSYSKEDVYTGSKGTWKRTYREVTQIRAGSLHQQRVYGFPDIFGLTKIPGTIWELTKLSWAVDYFFNVSDAIAAYTPDTLWECLGAWVTYRTTIEQSIEDLTVNIKDWEYPTFVGGKKTVITTTVQRVPGSFIGVHFNPKLNRDKVLDLLAVSRQQLSKLIGLCRKAKKRR